MKGKLDEGQNNDQANILTRSDLSVLVSVEQQHSQCNMLQLVQDESVTDNDLSSVEDNSGSGHFNEEIAEEHLNAMFFTQREGYFDSDEHLNIHDYGSTLKPTSSCHIVAFIKAQPMSKAHRVLIDTIIHEAGQRDCQFTVFVSKLQDPSSMPLAPVYKIRYLNNIFPGVTFTLVDTVESQLSALQKLGYKHIVWYGGKYKPGDNESNHKSARDTLAQQFGITIESKYIPDQGETSYDMRQAAKYLDLYKFIDLSPGGVPQYVLNSLYKDVRAGMQNPTPPFKNIDDLIKIALRFEDYITFKPIAKFNELEMSMFKAVVTMEETKVAERVQQFIKEHIANNDTIDDSIRRVIRTLRNWLRFYKFATHQKQEQEDKHEIPSLNLLATVAGLETSLHVMRNISAKDSDSNLYEYTASDISPNAVDLKVKEVFSFTPTMVIVNDLSNDPRPKFKIPYDKTDDHVTLKAGTYELTMTSNIKVGPTEAGWIIPHPQLAKHGYTIISRMYERGYEGPISAILTIPSGCLRLCRNTRVAKYITFETKSVDPPNEANGPVQNSQLKKNFHNSGLSVLTNVEPTPILPNPDTVAIMSEHDMQMSSSEGETGPVLQQNRYDNLEVECKCFMTDALGHFLEPYPCKTKFLCDVYFDNITTFQLAHQDKWLRDRNGTFELKIPAPEGHQKGISCYTEITDQKRILTTLNIPFPPTAWNISFSMMNDLLFKANYIPFACLQSTRNTIGPISIPIDPTFAAIHKISPKVTHNFQVDIDDACLEYMLDDHIEPGTKPTLSNYCIAEVEMLEPYNMDPQLAIRDVLSHLQIPYSSLQHHLNGKLFECLARHAPRHFHSISASLEALSTKKPETTIPMSLAIHNHDRFFMISEVTDTSNVTPTSNTKVNTPPKVIPTKQLLPQKKGPVLQQNRYDNEYLFEPTPDFCHFMLASHPASACHSSIHSDVYRDMLPDMTLATRRMWLRERGGKYQLKVFTCTPSQDFRTFQIITDQTTMLRTMSAPVPTNTLSDEELKTHFERHGIHAFASTFTKRQTFPAMTIGNSIGTCTFQVHVDVTHLSCAMTNQESMYKVAKLRILDCNVHRLSDFIPSIMHHLSFQLPLLRSPQEKAIHVLKLHNPDFYNMLVLNARVDGYMVRGTTNYFTPEPEPHILSYFSERPLSTPEPDTDDQFDTEDLQTLILPEEIFAVDHFIPPMYEVNSNDSASQSEATSANDNESQSDTSNNDEDDDNASSSERQWEDNDSNLERDFDNDHHIHWQKENASTSEYSDSNDEDMYPAIIDPDITYANSDVSKSFCNALIRLTENGPRMRCFHNTSLAPNNFRNWIRFADLVNAVMTPIQHEPIHRDLCFLFTEGIPIQLTECTTKTIPIFSNPQLHKIVATNAWTSTWSDLHYTITRYCWNRDSLIQQLQDNGLLDDIIRDSQRRGPRPIHFTHAAQPPIPNTLSTILEEGTIPVNTANRQDTSNIITRNTSHLHNLSYDSDNEDSRRAQIRQRISQAYQATGRKLVKDLSKLEVKDRDHLLLISALNQAANWQLKGADASVENKRTFSFYSDGMMHIDDLDIKMQNVLFDTGASHASYVAEEFINQHRSILEPFIYPHNSMTVLGDGQTKCSITECLIVPCTFHDQKKRKYTGIVKFSIYKTLGTTFIIGVPDICTSFKKLVAEMILGPDDEIQQTYDRLHFLEEHDPDQLKKIFLMNGLNIIDRVQIPQAYDDSEIPEGTNFFNENSEILEAEEDRDTPLACSFTEPLLYLSTTHEEAIDKYAELLKTNICPEFLAAKPEILDFMLSEECKNAFVPKEWKGLKMEPIDLKFRDDMPAKMRAKARPINPKIYENAYREFTRMRQYFYTDSTSDVAVNLVIAGKATPPYVRLCGNYPATNSYLDGIPSYPIPNVPYEICRLRNFLYYIDADAGNAFHQLRLSFNTSNKLSIITPWGLFRPLFMPEGISSATVLLQMAVAKIFEPFKEWMVVIFDNFLVMANSYDELFDRFKLVIARANEFQLVLKMAKTKVGYRRVDFFGYVIENGTLKLDPKRAEELNQVKFPARLKEVQRFLGSCIFFSKFIPKFVDLSAPLIDMTKKDFNWTPTTWKIDYKAAFEKMKLALANSCTLHLPDFTKRFCLFCDASEVGIGACLAQVEVDPNTGVDIYQPIGFYSKKFSTTAMDWATIKQEAYAIYAAVTHFEYYLIAKSFTVYTDHRNLVFIASDESSIITRWKFQLSRFSFKVQHIKGSLNVVADMLSRCYENPEHQQPTHSSPTINFLTDVISPDEGNTHTFNNDVDRYTVEDTTYLLTPSTTFKKQIDKDHRDLVIKKTEELLYDVPLVYTLTKNNLWLKQDLDSKDFTLTHYYVDENQEDITHTIDSNFKQISKYIKEKSNLKLNSIKHNASNDDFENILEMSLIVPIIHLKLKSHIHSMKLAVGPNFLPQVNNSKKHRFEVYINKYILKDPPSTIKFKYETAEITITKPGGQLSSYDALNDILQQLEIIKEHNIRPRRPEIEFIFQNDKKHYDCLVINDVILDNTRLVQEDTLTHRYLGEDEEAFKAAFARLHGSNSSLHFGARRTWQLFNKYYPNHKIPYSVIMECIATCPHCQMFKVKAFEGFQAVTKVLKPPTFRESVGIDRLSITPASKRGNNSLIVFVTMYTKLIFAVATSEYTGTSIARAILKFFSLYGKFNILRSDSGSDILSDATNQLLKWTGNTERIVALVGRPESSGVERSNYKIVEHLGIIVSDARTKDLWDEDEFLSLVLFKLNSSYNSETNMSAFTATFGDFEEEHFKFAMATDHTSSDYITQLHSNLTLINTITSEYQRKQIEERTASNPPTLIHPKYVENDLVMLRNRKIFKDNKLDPLKLGPYRVTRNQVSNDVDLEHCATKETLTAHVSELSPFHPNVLDDRDPLTQAAYAGELDSDQIIIKTITKMTGDYNKKSTLQFEVVFSDDSVHIKNYDRDLSTTVQFEDFIKSKLQDRPYLIKLLHTEKSWREEAAKINSEPITGIPAGDKLYTFLNSYGYDWFQSLNLPDIGDKDYVVQLTSLGMDKNKLRLRADLFRQEFSADQLYLRLFTIPSFSKSKHVLVDKAFAGRYPSIIA